MDRYVAITTTHRDETGCFTETTISPPLPAELVNDIVSGAQNRVRHDDNLNSNAMVVHELRPASGKNKPLSILRVAMVHAKPCQGYDTEASTGHELYRRWHAHNTATAEKVAAHISGVMRSKKLTVTSTP